MIIFEKVTRSFYPGDCGVFELDFLIETGEAVVLTGKSGAGKTTIMKLISREYTPETGEIYLDELVYSQLPKSQNYLLKRRVGVVYQDFLLINELTTWENIALPLEVVGKSYKEIRKRVDDLIRLVGLEGKEGLFPSQLSGGEAGRVGIARALALAPEVIFADEPTGNLDPQTSLEIAQILKKINRLGTTLILATHDPIIVDLFKEDRVIHLDKGRITSDSKPKDLASVLDKLKTKKVGQKSLWAKLLAKFSLRPTSKTTTKKPDKSQKESMVKPKEKTPSEMLEASKKNQKPKLPEKKSRLNSKSTKAKSKQKTKKTS